MGSDRSAKRARGEDSLSSVSVSPITTTVAGSPGMGGPASVGQIPGSSPTQTHPSSAPPLSHDLNWGSLDPALGPSAPPPPAPAPQAEHTYYSAAGPGPAPVSAPSYDHRFTAPSYHNYNPDLHHAPPPQAPAPGHACRTTSKRCSSSILPTAKAPIFDRYVILHRKCEKAAYRTTQKHQRC